MKKYDIEIKNADDFSTLFCGIETPRLTAFDKYSGIKNRFVLVSDKGNEQGLFIVYREGNAAILIGAARENMMQSCYTITERKEN